MKEMRKESEVGGNCVHAYLFVYIAELFGGGAGLPVHFARVV